MDKMKWIIISLLSYRGVYSYIAKLHRDLFIVTQGVSYIGVSYKIFEFIVTQGIRAIISLYITYNFPLQQLSNMGPAIIKAISDAFDHLVCVVIQGYKYFCSNDKDSKAIIKHESSKNYAQFSRVNSEEKSNLLQNKKEPEKKKWKKVQINQIDKIILCMLTQQQWIEQRKQITCSIGNMIMHEPAGMDCCSGKILAELDLITKHLNDRSICPFCGSQNKTTKNIIKDGMSINNTIKNVETFRKRLDICYEKMSKEFKDSIDSYFGEGYQDQHLKKNE